MSQQHTRPDYLVDLMDRVGIIPQSLEGLDRAAIDNLASGLDVRPEHVQQAARRWGLW